MQKNQYDILRGTWIYQEIRQQVQTEIAQQQRHEQCQTLLAIVHARFPRLLSLATKKASQIQDAEHLQTLLIQVASARTEKVARLTLQS